MATPGWLERFQSALLDKAAGLVLTAAGAAAGAGGTAIYHFLKDLAGPWTPYLAGYGAIFTFLAVVLSINQVQEIRERARKRRAAYPTPRMIESQAREWLYGFRYELKDNPQPTANFHMIVRDDQGIRISVFQEKSNPWVTIGSSITLENDAFGDRVRAAFASEISTIMADLSTQLAQLGVEFNVQGSPAQHVWIEHKVIFDESMTGLKFFRELMLVRRGMTLTTGVFRRATIPAIPSAVHDKGSGGGQ